MYKYLHLAKFKSESNLTPLHLAARKGHLEVCKILLENNVDKNPRNINEYTPLHFAAEERYKEATELLIKQGANMEKADNNGKTPRHHMYWL